MNCSLNKFFTPIFSTCDHIFEFKELSDIFVVIVRNNDIYLSEIPGYELDGID